MLSKKTIMISIVLSLFISNISMAVMYKKVKSVSGGEYHSLVLMNDKTLWSCGDNSDWQLGLGDDVSSVYSLKQVRGERGNGVLENVATYDAGMLHSLAADSTLWAWIYKQFGDSCNYKYF